MDIKPICVLFLIITCVSFFNTEAQDDTWNLSEEEETEIANQLKVLNKPYVKTFKDKNGNNYDCVDMYKQPAFDHPLLKNHSDQIRLSLQARQSHISTSTTTKTSKLRLKECPSGTVLIKRTKKEDLIRAKKTTNHIHPIILQGDAKYNKHVAVEIVDYSDVDSKEHLFYGIVAEMDVCQHKNLQKNQSSTAQVALAKDIGPVGNAHRNAIQFGWQIAPTVYGDSETHLFALYTVDDGVSTCLNYECGGFVQVSKNITLGMAFSSAVKAINMYVTKVMETGDWALNFKIGNDYEEVGYWPKKLFSNMDDVNLFEFGGIVKSPGNVPNPPMGNGVKPSDTQSGAKIDHIAIRTGTGFYVAPDLIKMADVQSAPDQYIIWNADYVDNGYKMEYGGPGGFIG